MSEFEVLDIKFSVERLDDCFLFTEDFSFRLSSVKYFYTVPFLAGHLLVCRLSGPDGAEDDIMPFDLRVFDSPADAMLSARCLVRLSQQSLYS